MTVDELVEATANHLIQRIRKSGALGVFAKRRAKFEGWLKVELIDILLSKGYNAVPEHGLIDVTFENVAIELKTVNTNYRDNIADNLIRPITKNIKSVIKDINKHRANKIENKFVIFIVFPSNDTHHDWQRHLQKIDDALGETCCARPFKFKSGIAGTIYY